MLRVKRNSGFSLVELMVVVAIIGILAAVAIPNFTRFQRKARAAESKDVLAGEYNAEKGFIAEWEGYTDNLFLAGYRIEGNLRTNAGFHTGAGTSVPTTISTQANATLTQANANCPNANTTDTATLCASVTGNCSHCAINPALGGTWPTAAAGAYVSNLTNGTANFMLTAGTDVGSGTADQWTMTDAKVLSQVQDGVNTN